jgi:hypothetical protein
MAARALPRHATAVPPGRQVSLPSSISYPLGFPGTSFLFPILGFYYPADLGFLALGCNLAVGLDTMTWPSA